MPDESTTSHREHKKAETRTAIQQAALDLAQRSGLEHVTVEAISAAADIAPRTFFNYFGCKEDAVIGDDPVALSALKQAIITRPRTEPALQAVRAAVRDYVCDKQTSLERGTVLARQRLIRDNPALLARQLARFARLEQAIAEAVAERAGTDRQSDPYPELLAAAAIATARLSFQRWARLGGSLQAIFQTHFDRLEAGL